MPIKLGLAEKSKSLRKIAQHLYRHTLGSPPSSLLRELCRSSHSGPRIAGGNFMDTTLFLIYTISAHLLMPPHTFCTHFQGPVGTAPLHKFFGHVETGGKQTGGNDICMATGITVRCRRDARCQQCTGKRLSRTIWSSFNKERMLYLCDSTVAGPTARRDNSLASKFEYAPSVTPLLNVP